MTPNMSVQSTIPQETSFASYRVLGARVDAVQIPDAIRILEEWIQQGGPTRYVAVTGMHGVSEFHENAGFRTVLETADLVVPDGMPLVWLGRLQGYTKMKRRVYGPELMETFCRETGAKYRHFFYGGAPGVAEHVAKTEQERHGIQ